MDDLVKTAIQAAESHAKSTSAVPWEFDKPWKQPYYVYSTAKKQWISTQPSDSSTASEGISRIALYSWNIDFMLPYPSSRMRAALRHLEHTHIAHHSPNTGTIIFLQECLNSDLNLIASDPWIQQNFSITDIDTSNWQSSYYGTLTLIDRRLTIQDSFRVHFSQTRMQRDGLFTDIRLGLAKSVLLRFCNAHLESLALEPAYRPPQMEMISRFMRDSGVDGAAVAGDFNAIQDFDLSLHEDNGLKDAYLELGGREEDKEGGHTWGQQASTSLRERFGTSRMDKVFFCGDGMKCVEFARFGAGVELEDEGERRGIVDLGFERPWITDHLGVKAVFELADDDSSGGGSGGRSSL